MNIRIEKGGREGEYGLIGIIFTLSIDVGDKTGFMSIKRASAWF